MVNRPLTLLMIWNISLDLEFRSPQTISNQPTFNRISNFLNVKNCNERDDANTKWIVQTIIIYRPSANNLYMQAKIKLSAHNSCAKSMFLYGIAASLLTRKEPSLEYTLFFCTTVEEIPYLILAFGTDHL